MNYAQGIQESAPTPTLSVCLPVQVNKLIRNLLRLPKLACSSPFLLFYVRRDDNIRRDKGSRSQKKFKVSGNRRISSTS